MLLALVSLACGAAPAERCRALALDAEATALLDGWRGVLDFAPGPPCVRGTALRLSGVTLDRPAGEPRVTFVVGVEGTVFLLSQSRAVREFTQVPDGASRIEWSVAGTRVAGFDSPAGAGPPLLYLRWEADGVIHEFQATPSRRFPVATLRELGRLNVEHSLMGQP